MSWHIAWVIISILLSVASFLPLSPSQHWFFRIFDFLRLQLLVVIFILLVFGVYYLIDYTILDIIVLVLMISAIIFHIITIYPYIPKWTAKKRKSSPDRVISMMSLNVQQKNQQYNRTVDLIAHHMPDILLTMETNQEWEKQLHVIKKRYSTIVNVPKENRYGMHFYTNLEVLETKVHYLISEEHPSIEARLLDKDDNEFTFWGIHPPPPSPTEKPTSKQKDAELLKVAILIANHDLPTIITGDFNNVCWSKVAKQFVKISGLTDARINRGFYSTFPSNYFLLRFPLDLIFHSNQIEIHQLKVLPNVGSDHLPIFAKYSIDQNAEKAINLISPKLRETAYEKIVEGKIAADEENE